MACEPDSRPLLALLRRLDEAGYDFVTPTPETHGRVLRRPAPPGDDPLRRLLGWSLPVDPAQLPPGVADLLAAAGALERRGGAVTSRLRVSRLKGLLFLHSAYPTTDPDAVFLGPDSYRFADLVERELTAAFAGRLVDLGGGCGVGALVAARRAPAARVMLCDINPRALRLARINAAHAGIALELVEADGLEGAPPEIDVVIANPPYMANASQTYSDGGAQHGAAVSLAWAEAALPRLSPGGRLLLYTGSAIALGGADPLKAALARICEARGARLAYRELDPDVFGEELDTPAYADVERIAAVGAVVTAAGGDGAA